MKLIKVFFVLAGAMALIISITAAMPREEEVEVKIEDNGEQPSSFSSSLRGMGRFLKQNYSSSNPREQMTCNKYPRICRAKGSPGPDCCSKKCVNVKTDRLNCGFCGKKCKYNEICCGGKCINPSSNKKHCGQCNIKCKKGYSCELGICNYA